MEKKIYIIYTYCYEKCGDCDYNNEEIVGVFDELNLAIENANKLGEKLYLENNSEILPESDLFTLDNWKNNEIYIVNDEYEENVVYIDDYELNKMQEF